MRKLTDNDYERMHLPRELVGVKLAKVPECIRGPIERYCFNAPSLMKEGLGFVLMGKAGVGKTAAAAVLAKAVKAHSPTVFFVAISELREFLKERVDFDSETTIYGRCREVDFLVLDGVDSDFLDDKYVGPAYLAKLVQIRAAWRRPTIVTTRLSKAELMSYHPDLVIALTDKNAFVWMDGPDLRAARAGRVETRLGIAPEPVVTSVEAVDDVDPDFDDDEVKVELPGPRGRKTGGVVYPTFKTKNSDED